MFREILFECGTNLRRRRDVFNTVRSVYYGLGARRNRIVRRLAPISLNRTPTGTSKCDSYGELRRLENYLTTLKKKKNLSYGHLHAKHDDDDRVIKMQILNRSCGRARACTSDVYYAHTGAAVQRLTIYSLCENRPDDVDSKTNRPTIRHRCSKCYVNDRYREGLN